MWLGLLVLLQAAIPAPEKIVIKSQRELQVVQGKSITVGLNDITVEADPELGYPNGFYLEIDDKDDKGDKGKYDVSGSTITPAADFTGKLKVKIRVTNGKVKSHKFDLQIDVIKAGADDGDDSGDDPGDDDDDDDDDGDNDTNVKPTIVSQVPVAINKNQSFTIRLSHLVVSDPDNDYPDDFRLKVEAGGNYKVTDAVVTPGENFVGALAVRVRVNDGKANSDAFDFKITVNDIVAPNVKPVITAQAPLSTFKNESVTLKLTDLSVTDPDNQYPADFTLTVMPGTNYTVSGHAITPSAEFMGMLFVKVKVNDGKDDSNVFDARVSVLERGTLQILGQNPITISEDSAYTFRLSDLNVSDPSDSYPDGFRLSIVDGDNYAVEGQTIRPDADFHGNLAVRVKVVKGAASSNVFEALVIVVPVNDPPAFATFDTAPIVITPLAQNAISKEVTTADVDNESLTFAEAELDSASMLTYLGNVSTSNVRGIFDQKNGVLVLLGEASLEEYDKVLQSITYTTTDSTRKTQKVRFRLNDGHAYSKWYEKTLTMSDSELALDIPTAFTPNNDNANDTWVITLLKTDSRAQLDLKVYNRQGVLLFESDSFERSWDGRLNGELLPADSYFFTLEVKTEYREARRKGIVTLLR
ncbi:T9SS type B sorting domain-containing protein [Fulvivirgaceae bacterium PWU4]|uniref:T9SS type B sorting domain-containing protein n=1 Tax=Chryseosolibacter histidini TaxID=2782349 RepID=A0AAP2DSA1_9BACT|nr:T9SS type B sorting domain-containing protein [Chryseosolibacter histidini]MBT1700378.1 T9SS type B sorting domain-containing protein [Chryseosolibacter histidini]